MTKVEDSAPRATDEPPRVPAEWQGDPLSGFPAEAEVAAAAARSWTRNRLIWVAPAALVVVAVLGVLVAPPVRSLLKAGPGPGILTVESTPEGVRVLEAGRELGVTPLTLPLPPGRHTLTLSRGGNERVLTVDVQSGSRVVHHVELTEAPVTGSLLVDSSPPGANVEVDGTARGAAPVTVTGLAPGEHDVTVQGGAAVFRQRVAIQAGISTSLTVPLARSDVGAGWLTVVSPIELQLYEGQSLVGSTRMDRVMLPAGSRTLRLANTETGFETTARVQVQAGVGTRLPVKLPNGQVSVNAVPWAEVFLDGRRIGETPMANFAAEIGSHEIVLRHPRYAEQRRTIVVSVAAPVRVGVDLRQ